MIVQSIDGATPLAEARNVLAQSFDLKFTPAVERETAAVYERVRDSIPRVEWPFFAPLILAINRLKKEKDAAILAHIFQAPQIFHGVADVVGNAATLARAARDVREGTIVQCGVRFMAENSKILSPQKQVLLPDLRAGCSLAASITSADLFALRSRFPSAPVVAHTNSPASVKAMSDVCCTSSNAIDIVNALDGDTVIMVPDQFLAQNVAKQTPKKIIAWAGSCEVHDGFKAQDVADMRGAYPDAKILAHPHCAPEVLEAADFAGGADQMIEWVRATRPAQVAMISECSSADNVAAAFPDVRFLRACNLCPHMKRITLENVLWSLHAGTTAIEIEPNHLDPARAALERMIALDRNLH